MISDVKTLRSLFFSALALSLLFFNMSLAAHEMRVWQSSKGSKTTAKIVTIGEKSVVLKTESGREITVLYTQLISEDVEYIKGLAKPKVEEKNEAQKEEKPVAESKDAAQPVYLPILTDGPGKGFYAYYEGKNYVAKVRKNGCLFLQIKDSSGNIVPKWRIGSLALSYTQPASGQVRYKDAKLLEHGVPQANAPEVAFKMLREKGITCEVKFEFTPEGFTTWFSADESADTPADTVHRIAFNMSTFDEFSKDDAYFKKMKMEREMVKGGKSELNFNEHIKPKGDAEEYEFSGSFFEKLKIIVKKGRSDNTTLLANTYPGMPIKNGVNLYLDKLDYTENDQKKEKVTFIFK